MENKENENEHLLKEIRELKEIISSNTSSFEQTLRIQKEQTQKILDRENRYKTLIANSPLVMFVVDAKGIFTMSEGLGLTKLGLEPGQVVGLSVFDVYKDFPEIINSMKEALDGNILHCEIFIQDITFDVLFSPIYDQERNVKEIIGVAHDISESKLIEQELRDSEERYKKAQNIGHVGSWEFDLLKNTFWGSDEAKRIYGFNLTDDVFNAKEVQSCVINRENADKALKDLIELDKPYNIEFEIYRYRTFDRRTIHSLAEVVRNGNHYPIKVYGTIHDITEQKLAQKKITQLSRAVEQSPNSVSITDLDGNIEYVNSKLIEITGYTSEELIGKNPRIFSSGEMPKSTYEILWKALKSGNEWRGEFHNKRKNGELYWEYAAISPIKAGSEDYTNYLAVKQDITNEKEIDKQLKLSLQKAEDSDKLKSTLLANMSHEFRTPMNGILGMASLLKEEVSTAEQKNMVEQINRSATRLMTTLHSVLELAQLESGENFTITKMNLNSELCNLYNKFKKRVFAKNLFFELDLGVMDVFIDGNVQLLQELTSHLIDNAIKFTNIGGITISIKINEDSGQSIAILTIKDSGIGISEDNCSIIFNEFRQVSEGYSRSYEGIGIGLTLVKKIASLMNWDISVQSKIDQGSSFILRIPVKETIEIQPENAKYIFQETQSNSKAPIVGSKEKKKLLYVEDNEINSFVVEKYIDSDYSYDNAKNAIEAIEKVNANNYDIILMDINLGLGMDGTALAKVIKEIQGYSLIPIVAVTGYAMGNDKNNLLNDGMTDYLAKPFRRDELITILNKYL